MRLLGVITARGGSKGLPRKNVRSLAGKPLIVHTIDAALGLGDRLYRLVVSTDDDEIAQISRTAGAEVPFKRPPELSRDDTPSIPVVQHAVRWVEENGGKLVDWILLLQPTSPLRTTADLAAALDLIQDGDPTAVIGVCEANESHPLKMKVIQNGLIHPYDPDRFREGLRRQDYPPVYKTNGAIYLVHREVLMEQNSLLGDRVKPLVMPAERSVDIDGSLDFMLAERLLFQARRPDTVPRSK